MKLFLIYNTEYARPWHIGSALVAANNIEEAKELLDAFKTKREEKMDDAWPTQPIAEWPYRYIDVSTAEKPLVVHVDSWYDDELYRGQ